MEISFLLSTTLRLELLQQKIDMETMTSWVEVQISGLGYND
jgi:hypothetical protein